MAAADVIPSDTAVYPPKPTPQLLRESYPSYLNLKLVLFVHRHGERTPIRSCTHLEFLSGFDLSLTVMPTVVSPVWNLCHMNSAFHANFGLLQEQIAGVQPVIEPQQHEQYHPAVEHDASQPKISESVLEPSDKSSGMSRYLSAQNLMSVGSIHRRIEEPGHMDADMHHAGQATHEPGRCFFGQLTDKGRESLFQIGRGLKALYGDALGFLPKKLDDAMRHVYFRTTDYPRTMESVQHLIGGLYPAPQRGGTMPIVYTRWPPNETLYGDNQCKKYRRDLQEFKKAYKDSSKEHIDEMHDRFKRFIDDPAKPSLHAMYDTFIALHAHGLPLPEGVTEKDIVDLEKYANSLWFTGYSRDDTLVKLGVGRFLGELKEFMDKTVENKSGVKMAVFSGHDSTVAPLLGAFQIGNDRWPPFAANVTVEVLEDKSLNQHFVRARYNGETKQLPFCQGTGRHHPLHSDLCSYETFMKRMDSLIPQDYAQECK